MGETDKVHEGLQNLPAPQQQEVLDFVQFLLARADRNASAPEEADDSDDDMREEYDFSNAVRGKFYREAVDNVTVVLLDPDIADAFPNPAAVNRALRLLVELARRGVASPA